MDLRRHFQTMPPPTFGSGLDVTGLARRVVKDAGGVVA
jgi:hypothetical protein